jgi:hypothetical protein
MSHVGTPAPDPSLPFAFAISASVDHARRLLCVVVPGASDGEDGMPSRHNPRRG